MKNDTIKKELSEISPDLLKRVWLETIHGSWALEFIISVAVVKIPSGVLCASRPLGLWSQPPH